VQHAQLFGFPVQAAALGAGPAGEQVEAEGEDRVAFRYAENPNGSADSIAGILSPNRRVLGLMPHPERAVDPAHGGTDGARLFAGLGALAALAGA
ncbi:MAG TPA: phosphoribosylformylglycinamidine synthase subunit PurQ, partial [Amaricoccus sp.]|nr:phosphoribosylformylglycinamidine synthase subunit PurQ [Amaricoccus sp.]